MAEETKKSKIIIVDDDDFLVNMYLTKFEQAGITAEAFKSGETILEALKGGNTPDLILLDIVIPGMNGMEILSEIRKQKLVPEVPILMLTNQNDDKDINDAKALGVRGYIVKSAATPSEVVSQVSEILKEKKG